MRYFPVRYDSRVVIYERTMLIRLATGDLSFNPVIIKFFIQNIYFLLTVEIKM